MPDADAKANAVVGPAAPLRRRLAWSALVFGLLFALLNLAALGLGPADVVSLGTGLGEGWGPQYNPARLHSSEGGETCEVRVGACPRATLPCARQPGSLRVVVAGESFADGVPYSCDIVTGEPGRLGVTHGGPADWLEAMLSRRWPHTPLQVINLGIPGSSSGHLLGVLPVIEPLQPDVVVVFTGNNAVPQSSSPTQRSLDRLPLYRVLRMIFPPLQVHRRAQNDGWGPSEEDLATSFDSWLGDVTSFAERANAQGSAVIFVGLPINLRWNGRIGSVVDPESRPDDAPFPLPWPYVAERLLGQPLDETCGGVALGPEALATLERKPCVRLAREAVCAEHAGDREAGLAARLRLAERCPTLTTRPSANHALEVLANEAEGVWFADGQARFLAASAAGLPDDELFWDHCHATWEGYFMVAEEIVRTLEGAGLVPGTPADPQQVLSARALAMEQGWHDLLRSGQQAPPPHR